MLQSPGKDGTLDKGMSNGYAPETAYHELGCIEKSGESRSNL